MDTATSTAHGLSRPLLVARRSSLAAQRAFTLVELLVVITIIGILASLITVAAVGALKKGQETRIKAELNQISDAIQDTKTKVGSYPPNCQTDGTGEPLDEATVLADLRTYLQQVAPRHKEKDELLKCLVGLQVPSPYRTLPGGMTSGEAIVFWLGGFSSDPKYPISGEGGPSYLANQLNLDPIESRKWVYPFEVTRLGPRNDDNYFDDSSDAGARYIEFPDPRNPSVRRRINFWQYNPAKSTQPFLYFDTSRHPAYDTTVASTLAGRFDPPAATTPSGLTLHVHALKKKSDTAGATGSAAIQFVDPSKFQVLHCGIDDAWGDEEALEQMSAHAVQTNNPEDYLLYPNGPFQGDLADTIVNFATQTRLEDAQPQ